MCEWGEYLLLPFSLLTLQKEVIQTLSINCFFGDNKKRLSYTFFSGSPGLMRAKIHTHIETQGKTLNDRRAIKQETFQIIYDQLVSFER